MEDLIDLMSNLVKDEDNYISVDVINSMGRFVPQESMSIITDRRSEWASKCKTFSNATTQAYGKILFLLTGREIYCQEDVSKWEIDENRGKFFYEIFYHLYRENYSISEKEALKRIGKQNPAHLTPDMIDYLKSIGFIEEPPEHLITMEPAVLDPDSDVSEEHEHYLESRNFPFLYKQQPRNLFCEFMRPKFLKCILDSKCFGKEAELLNQLPPDSAWRYVDKKYYYPWVAERVARFPFEEEETEGKINFFDMNEKLDKIIDMIGKIKVETVTAPEQVTVLAALTDIQDQLYSIGATEPRTLAFKPILPLTEPLFPKQADIRHEPERYKKEGEVGPREPRLVEKSKMSFDF